MNLAEKREGLTDVELNKASEMELREAMTSIENDFYRGLEIFHKDIIRRIKRTGVFVRDDAILVLKVHRQWWIDRPERERKASEEWYAPMIRLYAHLSIDELEGKLLELSNTASSFSKAARREFSGNGNRRTSAAVSAEGARGVGEHKLKLQSYIQWRKETEGK